MANVKSKQQKHSRVLITIPTLGDRLDLFEQTLKSIEAQGKNKVDLVVVCPLKNKKAVALAKKYGAKLVEDPGGLTAAVNAGFAQAQPWHEFAMWMGDDDLLARGAVSTTLAALDKKPKAVIAFGYCDYIDDTGKKIFTSKAGRLAPWIMTWGPNLVPLPGMLYRLSAVHKVGAFDNKLKYAMDLDMLLRLKKVGKFVNTKKVLGSFRWHSTSTTVANRNASIKETEMVKRRQLPNALQPFAPVWELPVRIATKLAARGVNAKADKL